METVVFLVAGAIILVGAIGVIVAKNPVHSALMLVMTLFGVAVQFLNLEAHFVAAVQVIVYAGAIVVLFLFVIMLLGVDEAEDLSVEPIIGHRAIAGLVGVAILGLVLTFLVVANNDANTVVTAATAAGSTDPDIDQIARQLFTDYVFAFEATGVLLTIAVVGAVVLSRKVRGELAPIPEPELAATDDLDLEEADD